jgi:hypothetical protein
MSSGTSSTLERAHVVGFELVKEHTARFVAIITGLDEQQLGERVPGGDWTVGETIAHVQSLYLRYTDDDRRSETPRGVAVQNAEDITRLGVDVEAAATTMTEHVQLIEGAVARIDPDRRFPFHAGQSTTLAGGWGNLLGELLAHGDDIARATGATFGLPSADMEIFWRFTAPLLQGWIRAEATDLRETWRLRFPFAEIDAVLDTGTFRWGDAVPGTAEPDHVIAVDDAATFALTFPYRRRAITEPTTALLATRFYDL